MQDLSLHILDLAENSINAGAKLISIIINENIHEDVLTVTIEDDGCGMEQCFLNKAMDPFTTTRTTRKVGLGLSLFEQACIQSEGNLQIESTRDVGTKLIGSMQHSHIDRKPLGNMPETIICLILGKPDVNFIYNHSINNRQYHFDTREIKAVLEDVSISNPQVIALIRENIATGLKEIAEA